MPDTASRAGRLDRAIADLLAQAPEVEAAAVVSFDGLPMASALPATMDEDRVAAMSAALLSLGERAAEGLGRGALSQVYIEGEHGTVFLVSADDEAVLVAVASKGAKVGMMLYEVRRAAMTVAEVLRMDAAEQVAATSYAASAEAAAHAPAQPQAQVPAEVPATVPAHAAPPADAGYAEPTFAETVTETTGYAPAASDPAWPSYLPSATPNGAAEQTTWS